MSTDDANFWIAVGSLGVSFASAILAFLAWRTSERSAKASEKSTELSEHQLKLAQEEARRHPILEVTKVRLLEHGEVKEVQETIREWQEWDEKLRKFEIDNEAWEERQESIRQARAENPRSFHSAELSMTGPIDPRHMQPRDSLLLAQRNYEEPWPDKVLSVTVVNRGKVAALDLSGELYLEAAHLCPLEFPGLDGEVELDYQEGVHKVEVYTEEGRKLLPGPTKDECTFRVAVVVKTTDSTNVRYAFTTPQGDSKESDWTLEVPPP